MNYRLAQDVGRGTPLVSGLVGIAQASIGHQQVIQLIGAPDSPNLYWALAELPRPIVDVRDSMRFEMSLGFRIFPFLLGAETASHSPQEWARLLTQALSDTSRFADSRVGSSRGNMELKQAAVAGLSLLVYPHARQRLLAAGIDASRLNAMPVGQVLAVDAAREYRRIADEIEKWTYVPYHIARHHSSRDLFGQPQGVAAASRGYGYVMAALLLPAVEAARAAEARLEWQTGALQVVEAARMHAARTGKLPASLEEIERIPIPLNPSTNQAYDYRLDEQTAVLDLPFSDGFPGVAWRLEVTLAHADNGKEQEAP
jgi:hypothetical protein